VRERTNKPTNPERGAPGVQLSEPRSPPPQQIERTSGRISDGFGARDVTDVVLAAGPLHGKLRAASGAGKDSLESRIRQAVGPDLVVHGDHKQKEGKGERPNKRRNDEGRKKGRHRIAGVVAACAGPRRAWTVPCRTAGFVQTT